MMALLSCSTMTMASTAQPFLTNTNTNIAGTETLPGTSLRASSTHGGSQFWHPLNFGTLPLRVSLGRSRSPAQSPSIPVPVAPGSGLLLLHHCSHHSHNTGRLQYVTGNAQPMTLLSRPWQNFDVVPDVRLTQQLAVHLTKQY